MLAFGPGLGQAFLATLFYALPALFLALMVGGLANPRNENWPMPDEAQAAKATYRRYANWGLVLNRLLFGLFLVQAVALLALRRDQCEINASHLSAAAWNIVMVADAAFGFGILVAAAAALGGIVWAVRYHQMARRNEWADPRRRDWLVVHIALVPLSLLLMAVAFGVVPRMVCPIGL